MIRVHFDPLQAVQRGCPDWMGFVCCLQIRRRTLLAASETSFELGGVFGFSEQTRAGSRRKVIDCTGYLSAASEQLLGLTKLCEPSASNQRNVSNAQSLQLDARL